MQCRPAPSLAEVSPVGPWRGQEGRGGAGGRVQAQEALRAQHTRPRVDPAGQSPPALGGELGAPVWSEVLFFSILLPYQGLSSLLTLQRPEEVRPFEGALRILPACWGPGSRLPQRFGCPPPERSLTLSLVHPFGTPATSACSSILSFSSFLFFHFAAVTDFDLPPLFY